ncbi:O-antigen ligase family protein [Methylobacterium sp.]|uniref:O-antigen ligase family protein n=1 Tax=Methylobacterium sp. TaxID=409 RepID=UPI0025E6168D|nr:O-antigen ligase family protein [Methylobacterium sp.]MBY0256584.1 O-antigen ligase family protein [Methylobacterium sp.]
MAISHALRPSRASVLIALAFLAAPVLAAALVLFAASIPGLSLLLIAGAAAGTAGLFLIVRPSLSLHGWFVLLVMPPALQVEPFHTLATNGACLAALASWLLADGLRRDPMAWNGTLLLLGLCILWACISLLWAPDIVEGRRALIAWVMSFLLLFLLLQRTRSLEGIDALMLTLGLAGWLLILAGLFTVTLTSYDFTTRLQVLGINENMYGILLIIGLPGAMWPVMRASGGRRAVLMALSVVYLLLTLAFVALSGSRGSALSLLIVLFLFLFSRPVRPWGIAGLGVLVALLLVAPFVLGVVLHRVGEEEGSELGGRAPLWAASLDFIRDHPWTGGGVGNGPFALHAYMAAATGTFNHRIDLPSHQPFLEIAVDTGLFGLVLYVLMLASAVWIFATARRRWLALGAPPGYYPVVIGVTVGFVVSWFKAGGMKHHPTLILLLALMLIPAHLTAARGGVQKAPRQHRVGGETSSV